MDWSQSMIDSISGGIAQFQYDGGLVLKCANEAFYAMLQTDRLGFLDKYDDRYERVIYPSDWEKLKESIPTIIRVENRFTLEYRVMVGESKVWHCMQATVSESAENGICLQCVISDISEYKQIQKELEKEREKLRAVVKMSGDMIFEYDIANDHMTYTNTGEDILFSRKITENYTKNLYELIKKEDEDAGRQLLEAIRSGRENFYIELRRMGTDGEYHWVSVTCKTLYDDNRKPRKVLGKIRNIDEQKKHELELKEKSQKDSLTGLYNHMTAKTKIIRRIQRRSTGQVSYLIVCDIDSFKRINDTNGHMFGDAVICSVAKDLAQSFPESIVGRIGGDEFLLYVENLKREILEERLSQINETLKERFEDEQTGLKISCSLGAVTVDGSVREFETLFQWADYALYVVKNNGKGSFYVVEPEYDEQAPTIGYLEGEDNTEEYARRETIIKTEEELVLFCVELLENVPVVANALKMISERTCSFLGIDEMIFIEHNVEDEGLFCQWGKAKNKDYTSVLRDSGVFGWEFLRGRADKRGSIVFREKNLKNNALSSGKSVLVTLSEETGDYRGSIIFVEREFDRDWEKEKSTLIRISNQIFTHLRYQKAAEKTRLETEYKLNYDELTGLPVFNRFMQEAEAYMQQQGGEGLYALYVDFSNFQYLNEIYGFESGDKVLVRFAKYMQSEPCIVMCCHVTSDHFVGMFRAQNDQEAHNLIQSFTERFAADINKDYSQCNFVVASGIYGVKDTDRRFATALDNANEARKQCKEQKVITAVVVYTEEIRKKSESVKAIVANMVSAYKNKEFYAYLQPKVSLKTGKIVGAEALVRWIRPDGSRVMPGEFIEIFERSGFITKIDFVVLEQVMAYLQEAMSKDEPVVPISVNFSRRHNEFENFIPSIKKRLERYQVPGNMLEAELTESVFMSDVTSLSEKIHQLREVGIEVSVDDFGSGYSSLSLLGRVTVDTIKLDKQFLDNTLNEGTEESALTIIKYLIKMLKHLGFKVLAEGVETEEQIEMLKKADCDIVQGYYYAKPMPIAEFREFLLQFNGE